MSSSVNGFLVSGSGHLTCTSTGSFSCVSASGESGESGSGESGSGGSSSLPIFEVDGVIDASTNNWQFAKFKMNGYNGYNFQIPSSTELSTFHSAMDYSYDGEQLMIGTPSGYSDFSDGVLLKVLSHDTITEGFISASINLTEKKVHHKGVPQNADTPGFWEYEEQVDDYPHDFANYPNDGTTVDGSIPSEPYATHPGFTLFNDASQSMREVRHEISMFVLVTNLEARGLDPSANGIYRVLESQSSTVVLSRMDLTINTPTETETTRYPVPNWPATTGGDAVGTTVAINNRYDYDIASPTFLQNYAFNVRYGRTFGNKTFTYDATAQDFVEQT